MYRVPQQTRPQALENHWDGQNLDCQAILSEVDVLRAITPSIESQEPMDPICVCGRVGMQAANHFPSAGGETGLFYEFPASRLLYARVGWVDGAAR